jgi:hypothetical protein
MRIGRKKIGILYIPKELYTYTYEEKNSRDDAYYHAKVSLSSSSGKYIAYIIAITTTTKVV